MYDIKYLKELLSASSLRCDEPLNLHTTFKIGGPAEIFVDVGSLNDLVTLVAFCKKEEISYFVLGKGSNLLVSDEGVKGVIIHLIADFTKVEIKGETAIAGAGISLSKLSTILAEHELTGMEFASGIPGSLGGGVFMNAGAYGGEMKDVIEGAYVLLDGEVRYLTANELKFAYRYSIIKDMEGAVITSIKLRLKKDNKETIFATIKDLNKRRQEKQPLEFASAGSMFKRPEVGYASKLIEEAGLKGVNVGDAEVSVKHSGFIINKGGATAKDVKELIKIVQKRVEENSGIKLYPEVRFL